MFRFIGILLATFCLTQPALGQVLYTEDFQDGNADGWIPEGRGDVRVTSYAGNNSLRLTRSASASIGLRVSGPPKVRIGVAFAAQDLEGRDACIAETSVDGTESWDEFHRIEDGADDAVTLYPGSVELVPPADQPLFIRVRIKGNGDNDTCWVDNIQISAVAQRNVATTGPRQSLTAEFLASDSRFERPVAMREFAPIFPELTDIPAFQGKLRFSVSRGQGSYVPIRDRFSFASSPVEGLEHPPAFGFDVVSDGTRLIPRNRALQVTDHPAWDVILSAGQIWKERGDDGQYRAAIPFALQEKNANCTHNGVLTFLIADGMPASDAAYQISSETCAYHQFDMWGRADIASVSRDVKDGAEIVAAYARERENRLPIKSFSELQRDHPSLDATAFASSQDITPEHLTVFGVVVEAVHYRSSCFTRYGDYPYCDDMALPSYSTAKSVFAGLGLMRLEQLYSGAKDALIADYVDECRRSGWEGITFDNALDMTTGRFQSKTPDADESAAVRDGFFLTPLHAEKIQRACRIYPRRERPGRSFVYHTTDHYVLGTAMRAYLAQKRGKDIDIYTELVANPLDSVLDLSPMAKATRRTTDPVGQPYVGWGLTFLSDDVAKVGSALAGSDPMTELSTLFGSDELAAALHQSEDDPGLPAPNAPLFYNNGFWAYDAASALSCRKSVPVPFMSGFGGISIVPMPNGVTYYYFSDNEEFRFARAIAAADQYKPICEVR